MLSHSVDETVLWQPELTNTTPQKCTREIGMLKQSLPQVQYRIPRPESERSLEKTRDQNKEKPETVLGAESSTKKHRTRIGHSK